MALPTCRSSSVGRRWTKAAESRRYRSEVLGRLKAGQISLAELLGRAGDGPVIGKTRVQAALRNVVGIGAVTAAQLMAAAEIPENRRLSGLGPRQAGPCWTP